MLNTLAIIGAKYLFLLLAGLAFIYFLKQSRAEQKRLLLFATLTLPLTFIIGKLGGFLYDDPRPFITDHFAPLIPHEADNGFPSDHTLLCAAIAMIIYPSNKRLSLILWILTLLVGISRIGAGLHHATDIIGSILIAIVAAWIVKHTVTILQGRYKEDSIDN